MSTAVKPPAPRTRRFFISYSHKDKKWAKYIDNILREKDCESIADWDFAPGANIIREMEKASATAAGTIALISPSYIESNYCMDEWQWARDRRMKQGSFLLVPVMVEECSLDTFGPIKILDFVKDEKGEELSLFLKTIGASGESLTVPVPRPRLERARQGIRTRWALWGMLAVVLAVATWVGIFMLAWPKNYFPGKSWNDNFSSPDNFAFNWRRTPPGGVTRLENPMRMEIGSSESAMTSGELGSNSFYDFDAHFIVAPPVNRAALWAFRTWPQDAAVDISRSHGYRFSLEVVFKNGESVLRLNGEKCEYLGNFVCTPLVALGAIEFYRNRCTENLRFQIRSRAEGGLFTFVLYANRKTQGPTNSPGDCADGETAGKLSFRDDAWLGLRIYRFGAIAFLNAQTVYTVSVYPLHQLDPYLGSSQ